MTSSDVARRFNDANATSSFGEFMGGADLVATVLAVAAGGTMWSYAAR